MNEISSVLACCNLLAKIYKINISHDKSKMACTNWKDAAIKFGKENFIQIKIIKNLSLERVKHSQCPLVFKNKLGKFAVLARVSEKDALLQDPFSSAPEIVSLENLMESWSGTVLIFKISSIAFFMRWIIPEFSRQKKYLMEVFFISFVLQIMGLLSPLFFQVVMDKVLVHNNLTTLDVLAIILTLSGIAEVLTKGFREYLLSHIMTKMDIHLGLKVFEHLIKLPLPWFKNRKTGTIISRMLELESIRDFLTGSTLTIIMDIIFSFVFIIVMYCISPALTGIVVVTMPLYILLAFFSRPHIHARTEKQYFTNAINTAFLNETIGGVETIKSLAVEPTIQNKYEKQISAVSDSTYQLHKLNASLSQAIMFIQRLTTVAVIWLGSYKVMALQMTVGELIAFNMLLNQVLQPLSNIIDYFQKYVQTHVGLNNLTDIIKSPMEFSADTNSTIHKIEGDIIFQDVTFYYGTEHPPVLDKISLKIHSGERIGIVGPSGSGKSTLSKLIQKLYATNSGNIYIDGLSLHQIPTEHLRKQIGVVLQENYLFNMSVSQNICLQEPTASFDSIVKAARLAGADEFIRSLPMGYDTILAEGGSSLSGGQRQRIAIARALLTNPRILIFDEATSALDEESQAVIQSNMRDISQGRTVIIIAHRLSTIKECDRIIVIEKGRVSESGVHHELLSHNGCYSRLYHLQQSHEEE